MGIDVTDDIQLLDKKTSMQLFNQPYPVLILLISWSDNNYPDFQRNVNEQALKELHEAYLFVQSSVMVFYANTNDQFVSQLALMVNYNPLMTGYDPLLYKPRVMIIDPNKNDPSKGSQKFMME